MEGDRSDFQGEDGITPRNGKVDLLSRAAQPGRLDQSTVDNKDEPPGAGTASALLTSRTRKKRLKSKRPRLSDSGIVEASDTNNTPIEPRRSMRATKRNVDDRDAGCQQQVSSSIAVAS